MSADVEARYRAAVLGLAEGYRLEAKGPLTPTAAQARVTRYATARNALTPDQRERVYVEAKRLWERKHGQELWTGAPLEEATA